ncbi:hypothetical protein ACWGE0_43775 [Lentzea sp. NPDC054927]
MIHHLRAATPRALDQAVAGLGPKPPLENSVAFAISNWVSYETAVHQLAAPTAEPLVHGYLQEAHERGMAHGLKACLVFCLPVVLLALAASAVLSTLL